jgi:hypothetical protein
MGLYKFMHWADRSKVEAGSLRFGRIRYYRLLEVMTDDSHIGDRREGISTNIVPPMSLTPSSPPEILERLSGIIGFGPGATGSSITISGGMTIYDQTDGYVFSMAEGRLPDLVSSMCSADRASYAYDGCVEVLDRSKLMSLVSDASIVESKVSDYFTVTIDKVQYTDAVGDQISQPMLPSLFRKSCAYSYQSEIRIALQPKASLPESLVKDALYLQINPAGLFLTHEIDVPARSKAPRPEVNLEEALEVLRSNSLPGRSRCTQAEWLLIRNAYWELRQAGRFQDDQLDMAFLEGMTPFGMFNRLYFGLQAAQLHHVP